MNKAPDPRCSSGTGNTCKPKIRLEAENNRLESGALLMIEAGVLTAPQKDGEPQSARTADELSAHRLITVICTIQQAAIIN